MYPLHLNYTTTLPCKTITIKITIFTGETGLPPTAVTSLEKTNGHQTLILLIIMSGQLCLNATRHVNPSQNHRRAEESLANNMGWSATELHQQCYTELCKKTLSLCVSLGRTLWTHLEINCFCSVLNCQQAVTVWNVTFPRFRLISIQALWWKL